MRLLPLLAMLFAACAPAPLAPPAGPAEEEKPGGCEVARDADFEGDGERRLRRFLRWMAHVHGVPAGLPAEGVSLAIVRGTAKAGPTGVQVGEVSCGNGAAGPFRVTLYRDGLVGRPLAVAYDTLAHEFHHVVQIHRDKLPCGPGTIAEHAAYEREAEQVARRFVPKCR